MMTRILALFIQLCVVSCGFQSATQAVSQCSVDAMIDAQTIDAQMIDSSVEMMIDASPDSRPILSLTTPWQRSVITQGIASGTHRGADGTAFDAEGCVVTAWEEGGMVSRACRISDQWSTEIVATGISGAEDAKAADLDGDDVIDVVTCSDSGGRCYVTFRGAINVTTTLIGTIGHGHAMQVAITDVDGDGLIDVVYGTRVGTPAIIGWCKNPGAPTIRDGSTWICSVIDDHVGWTMSLIAMDVDHDGDVDLVTSDRSYYLGPTGARLWDHNGARWLEHTLTGWINHRISPPAGACPVNDPLCATKTPGDEMFLSIIGDDVWDCQSSSAVTYNRIVHHHTVDWINWTHTVLPAASNVGHCQGVLPVDVDGDGVMDVIVTTWKGNAYPVPPVDTVKSGAYWLHGPTFERGEISGQIGGKFDNAIWDGSCVITSEQLDPAGGLGVVRYCPEN